MSSSPARLCLLALCWTKQEGNGLIDATVGHLQCLYIRWSICEAHVVKLLQLRCKTLLGWYLRSNTHCTRKATTCTSHSTHTTHATHHCLHRLHSSRIHQTGKPWSCGSCRNRPCFRSYRSWNRGPCGGCGVWLHPRLNPRLHPRLHLKHGLQRLRIKHCLHHLGIVHHLLHHWVLLGHGLHHRAPHDRPC